jgi:hypothetical protein
MTGVYTSGFGSSNVVGFQASGANHQIQLQTSMFSGLTPGQGVGGLVAAVEFACGDPVGRGRDHQRHGRRCPQAEHRLSGFAHRNAGNVFKFV